VVIPVRRTAQSPRILQVLRVTSRIMPFIRLHLASRAAHGDHQGADIAQSGGDQVGRGEGGELCAPFRRQGSRGTPTRDRAIPVATDSLKSGRSLRHAVPPWIYSHARPNRYVSSQMRHRFLLFPRVPPGADSVLCHCR
jgi:hypothetical protein